MVESDESRACISWPLVQPIVLTVLQYHLENDHIDESYMSVGVLARVLMMIQSPIQTASIEGDGDGDGDGTTSTNVPRIDTRPFLVLVPHLTKLIRQLQLDKLAQVGSNTISHLFFSSQPVHSIISFNTLHN